MKKGKKMTTIKNFEAFKKSLLSATNGTVVETFDDSIMFAGSDYQSYRIYVDDVHYYNMFVIYYFTNNSYDVSLETSCCGTSTMLRTVKTQKALIESVVAWINNNHLCVKTTSEDSEDYTDRCETSEDSEDYTDRCETTETTEIEESTEDHTEHDEILDRNESTDRDRINYLMRTNSFPSISEMYNDKCFCCPADRPGNRCCGEKWCAETWKRYEAIINPEWHHVSLATLANLDFDMLDKKRQVYLKAHSELKRTLADLSKCKTAHTYEARARKFFRDMKSRYYRNEISNEMRKYLYLQISMSNVINGVWSSYVEPAMGLHESRRYQ